MSIDDIDRARRAFFRADAEALRKRAESVLGFGGTTPSRRLRKQLELKA